MKDAIFLQQQFGISVWNITAHNSKYNSLGILKKLAMYSKKKKKKNPHK